MKGYIIMFFIFFVFGVITDVIAEFGGIDSSPAPKQTRNKKQQAKKNQVLKHSKPQTQKSKTLNSSSKGNIKSTQKKKKKPRKYQGKYLHADH